MPKLPAIQFYPGDWLRDDIAGCSLAAQGLWLRMMFLMHDSDRYGYLAKNGVPIPPASAALRCGTNLEQYTTLLAELDLHGVPSRTDDGIIYSRRMVRDAKAREEGKRFGKLGGNPALTHPHKRGVKGGDNPPRRRRGREEKESSGKKVQEKGVEFIDLIPEPLRTPRFLKAWGAWIKHRHERKPAYTAGAAERALPKLAEEGEDAAVERIDRSIMNGWLGLFFNNEKPGGSQGANGHEDPKAFAREAAKGINREVQHHA